MDLVDGEDGRGRIVDGRREGLVRDVDDDPEREPRVLLERALSGPTGRKPRSSSSSTSLLPAVTRKSGSPLARKSPTCGTISTMTSAFDGGGDDARRGRRTSRSPTTPRGSRAWRPSSVAGRDGPCSTVSGPSLVGIDGLDDLRSVRPDHGEEGDRPQVDGQAVGEVEEDARSRPGSKEGDRHAELRHFGRRSAAITATV